MPWQSSANPGAANNEQPLIGGGIIIYTCDPGATTPVMGNIVELEAYTPPTTPGDGQFTPPYVKQSSGTSDFLLLGVVVGGSSLGTNPTSGGLVMVKVEGPASILLNNTSTVGHLVIQSSTAGVGADSATATLGKTIAVVTQAVTISSGTALVNCYVHKM